jgi:hypothetical protein
MDILDILLLPKKFYKSFTAKKPVLFMGIILDGLLFVALMMIDNFSKIFHGKSVMLIYFNATLALVFIALIGFIDILFFSVPIFDLFKLFGKEKDEQHSEEILIKLMKVYICATIVIFPINLIFTLVLNSGLIPPGLALDVIGSIIILLPSVWGSAIIARGVNELYNFHPFFKKLVFLVVMAWSTILGIALIFIMDNWLMVLFK